MSDINFEIVKVEIEKSSEAKKNRKKLSVMIQVTAPFFLFCQSLRNDQSRAK